jgi:probable HAF family extracellular repeat protein
VNAFSKYLGSLAIIGWSAGAMAQNYQLTEIGSLGGSQGSFTNWGSVNDSGQVTGYSYLSGSTTPTAFIYSNGTIRSVGAPAPSQGYGINDSGQVTGVTGTCGFYTSAGSIVDLNSIVADCGVNPADTSVGVSINDKGNVAGYATGKGGVTVAAYFSGGKIKNLGTLGGTNSYGHGVNNGGQVTGYSETAASTNHAFISSSTGLIDLGTLGGDNSIGYAINGFGNITGYSDVAGNTSIHAFFYNDGTGEMHDLGGLGGTAGSGLAINNAGDIVGWANNADGDSRAFLYSAKKLVNLNSLIPKSDPLAGYVTLTSATGISNSGGYIVAEGVDTRSPGVNEVFLLTPIDAAPR